MYDKKIKLLNTEKEINNNFWVCLLKDDKQPQSFDNSINKDEKIKTVLDLDNAIKKNLVPFFLLNQQFLIHSDYDFETVRAEKYSDYPSRCSSFFVFPTKEDMEKCLKLYKWKVFSFGNVYINTDKPYKVIEANMEYVSSYRHCIEKDLKPIPTNFLDLYWQGNHQTITYERGPSYPPIIELLIEGEVLAKKYFKDLKSLHAVE